MRCMMGLAVLGWGLMLIGCALFEPVQVSYLKTAQGHATQQEVRQRLGPPHLVRSLEAGSSVWVYEFLDHEYGDRNRQSGIWCDEYRLTFDQHTILRQWDRGLSRHPGDLMPAIGCVPGASAPRG